MYKKNNPKSCLVARQTRKQKDRGSLNLHDEEMVNNFSILYTLFLLMMCVTRVFYLHNES